MCIDRIDCGIAVEAPVERVWAVLTEPHHLTRWYAFGGAEIDLRPFGWLTFRWKERGTFHGLIATLEPPYALTFLCTCLTSAERPRVGNSTLIEFSLEPAGHLTRVRVAESGFSQLRAADAMKDVLVASSERAWGNGLGLLRRLAEQ